MCGQFLQAENKTEKNSSPEKNGARVLKFGREFKDDKGIRLEWVDPGSFVAGTDENTKEKLDKINIPLVDILSVKETQRKVTITRGFWMSKSEVTISDYLNFLNSGTKFVNEKFPMNSIGISAQFEKIDGIVKMRSGKGYCWGDLKLPVLVSWQGAKEFCEWLNNRARISKSDLNNQLPEGYSYTLPTEAEWEFACRAGTTGMTPLGDLTFSGPLKVSSKELEPIAWYAGNSRLDHDKGKGLLPFVSLNDVSSAGLHPVNGKLPNNFKLYDMLGNAQEWCLDWHIEDVGMMGKELVDPMGPTSGEMHSFRGGAWYMPAVMCRSASRPVSFGDDALDVGFRIAIAYRGNQIAK